MHQQSWTGAAARMGDASALARPWQMRRAAKPLYFRSLLSSVNVYVLLNISRRITIEDLAKIANLNAYQLIRVFHREYATTPYALVVRIRVERAKELLRSGVKIADAAIDTGFSDQSHLTRHFKRLEGVTPKVFLSNQGLLSR